MATDALREAGTDQPLLEAQVLASHILSIDRSRLLAHPEYEIDDEKAGRLLARRVRQEPLAYILGYREFYGRRFRVTPDVLIPRQETETLITAILELERRLPKNARVLDLGTGSGCIGVTLKLERPNLSVTLSDVSPGALGVAAANARALGADVELVLSNAFENLQGPFHCIVSNPPYVANSEHLPIEVGEHEPHMALFSGPSGLEFYRRLANEASSHLDAGTGFLLFEVGDGQARSVSDLFADRGWTAIDFWNDLLGTPRALAMQPGAVH